MHEYREFNMKLGCASHDSLVIQTPYNKER